MADFSGVTNPKRVVDKRLKAAEDEGAKPAAGAASAPKGSMSQADFAKYGAEPESVKARKAKDLADLLRKR